MYGGSVKMKQSSGMTKTLIFILSAGLVLVGGFLFYKRYVCSSKISNEKLIDEINSELIETKNIYD